MGIWTFAQQGDAPEPYAPDKIIVVLTPFGRSAATMFLSSAPGPVIFDVGRNKNLEFRQLEIKNDCITTTYVPSCSRFIGLIVGL